MKRLSHKKVFTGSTWKKTPCLVVLLVLGTIHFLPRGSRIGIIPWSASNLTQGGRLSQSICSTLPGFYSVDSSPIRSPLLVADHLINLAAGRVVFEVGTRNGDILSCISHFANLTFSAEIDPEYCQRLRGRGLRVFCDDFLALNMSGLSQKPDVFFWWPMVAKTQNEVWLSHVRSQASYISPECIVVIGFDHQHPPDMANREVMLNKYPEAQEHVIDFNEGQGRRMQGKFSLIHFYPHGFHVLSNLS